MQIQIRRYDTAACGAAARRRCMYMQSIAGITATSSYARR
eukprot:SAG31_NODE_46983_length_252_cov_0.673203_1_plen_39_part_10